MQNPLYTYDSTLEELAAHISDLERRLSILEHDKLGCSIPVPPSIRTAAAQHPPESLSSVVPGRFVAVGKGVLGIAGAYLLRALNESGTVPQLAVVFIALAYAVAWLLWASRPRDTKVESGIYAFTAALIFSPMLWELTVRFKVLPPAMSAAALLGFVVLATALAWKRKLMWLTWAATLLPLTTAVVLLVATRDPAPFVSAILLMALVTESAGLHHRIGSLSIVASALADLAILLLIAVYSGEANITSAYEPITTATLLALTSGLFMIYGGAIAVSTIALGRTISWFGVGQVVVAFLIAVLYAARVTHDTALPVVAILSLAAAFGCYFAAFVRFDRFACARNYHVFATWAAALLLVSTLCLSQRTAQVVLLSLAAIAAVLAAMRSCRWTLGFHGAVYLGVAGCFSRLWDHSARTLVGAWPAPSTWIALLTAVCVIVCCALIWHGKLPDAAAHTRNQQTLTVLRLFFSSLVAFVGAAALVSGIVWAFPGWLPSGSPSLAVVRTLVLCATVLIFSFAGTRWNHIELVRIAYGAIALCALKLLFEDLRVGSPVSLAISLLFYGSVFVLVPRLGHSASKQ